ncbi:MAG: PE-PPE domain-containing protein, partial [Gordonia sp. (in: high G+C Gram-positive bacteria)]
MSIRSKHVGVVFAAAAVIGALGIPAGVGLAHADDAYDCKAGAVVIVAGTGDPDAQAMVGVAERYTGKRPILDENGKVKIVEDAASPYHGADADGNTKEYKVLYAEYPTTLWPVGSVGYNEDVALGVASTKYQIAEYQKNCPDKGVVVTGYSQGARVAGDVLSDIANGRDNTVLVDGQEVTLSKDGMTGELYSDPRRDGPESGRGIELSMIGVIPGLTMTGARPGGFGGIPVTTYCYEGDPVCDLPDLLHDPFGVLDGLVGYFTKHGYYPTRMWAGVGGATWKCASKESVNGYTDCVVRAPSAIAEIRQNLVNDVRKVVGLDARKVIDFWGLLPNINSVLPHANLADLQQYISPVMDFFPSLPKLGYGGYLPDLFVFTDLLQSMVTFNVDLFVDSVEALGKSVLSIVKMPVAIVDYWGNQAINAGKPKTTSGGDVDVLAVDAGPTASTNRSVEVLPQGAAEPAQKPEIGVAKRPNQGAAQSAPGSLATSGDVQPQPESDPKPDPKPESKPVPQPEPEVAAQSPL